MKFSFALLILLSPLAVLGQDTAPATTGTVTNPNPIVTLAGSFLEHNFFNFYAYGNGVYDTFAPIEQNGNFTNGGSFGYELGGGVNGNHAFRNGNFSISYQGGYRNYQSNLYGSGTYQNLGMSLVKRFSRRWTFSWTTGAGIYLYGGSFFTPEMNGSPSVVTNPFSSETRFFSTGVSVAYQQTRHLSYVFSGNLFLQRYNYVGGIGSTGGTGSVGVQYRFAPRTSLGGGYSYSYYKYQHAAGQAKVQSVSLSLTHVFPDHWTATVSGGISHSDASGTTFIPVTLLIGNEAVGGYIVGNYREVVWIPAFSGTLSHSLRRYLISVTAGQGVSPSGNGYYLASRTDYLNGVVSRGFRRSNISGGVSYYRLTSVANSVNASYITTSFSGSYGVNLMRYLGAFFRYDFNHYGALRPFNGTNDNRFSFGINFSSKSIPMTLF